MLSRRIDSLGRIVIPKEIRDTFGWKLKDPISITTHGKNVVLGKVYHHCYMCSAESDLIPLQDGFLLCVLCLKAVSDTAKAHEDSCL